MLFFVPATFLGLVFFSYFLFQIETKAVVYLIGLEPTLLSINKYVIVWGRVVRQVKNII